MGEASHLFSPHPDKHKAQHPNLSLLSHFPSSQAEVKFQLQTLMATTDLQTLWHNSFSTPGWCFSPSCPYSEDQRPQLVFLSSPHLPSFWDAATTRIVYLTSCLNRAKQGLQTSTHISPCCKYSPCKKTESCHFSILTQICSRCGYFHISINTVSCLLAQ